MSTDQDFLNQVAKFMADAMAENAKAGQRNRLSRWKQVKPVATAAGRRRAFEQLLVNALERAEVSKALLKPLALAVPEDLGELAFDLEAHSLDETLIVLTESLASQGVSPPALDRVLAYQYMAARVSVLDNAFVYESAGGRDCARTHWLHCLLVAGGAWSHARWTGRYLMNFHRGGLTRFFDEDTNPQIQGVLRLIARITEDDEWPQEGSDAIDDALGPYKALIQSVTDPSAFREALMRVMDFRMARYNSHQDVDTAGRSPKWSGVLASEYWALVPAEVLAIRALARKHLGIHLDLHIDHPWLQHALALSLPPIDVAWEDALLAHIQRGMLQRFGPDCMSLTLPPRLTGEEVRAQIAARNARI